MRAPEETGKALASGHRRVPGGPYPRPLLGRDEELRLARDARPGSVGGGDWRAARNELVERNFGLAVSVARRYRGRGVPFEDLVQEGVLGLIRATETFDPERGHRFSTYATWWIRQRIGPLVAGTGRPIRLPAHMREKASRLLAARETLLAASGGRGREPTDGELAVALESGPKPKDDPATWTAAKVAEIARSLSLASVVDSLDRPARRDGGRATETPLAALVVDPEASEEPLRIEEARDREASERSVRDAISRLTERQRHVLRRRYGLEGTEPATLKEVGTELGVSKESAHKLQRRAEKRLKRLLEDQRAAAMGLSA